MNSPALAKSTVMPPEDREEMMKLLSFFEHQSAAILHGPDGEEVRLPFEVYETLIKVVEAMSVGNAITLLPVHKMLTTQEVAQFLGVSRPTVVKMLEEGKIPFEKTGTGRHRRVRLVDAMAFQNRQREERSTALREMADDAQVAGFYEESFDDYRAALKAARAEQ